MRKLRLLFFVLIGLPALGQENEKINIPAGVVYKYVDAAIVEKAKALLAKEFSDSVTYALDKGVAFIGPVIWMRYKKIAELNAIQGGDVTILFNQEKLSAKLTQRKEDFKKIWDQLRSEIKPNGFKIRKATAKELEYYWAVISFDIQEPLLIAESGAHRFLFNLSSEDLTLVWLDEVPASMK